LHARYLVKHLRPDGSLYSDYEPFQNKLYEGVSLPRLGHAAWVLARYQRIFGSGDLKDAADRVIEYLLGTVTSTGEEVWLKSGDEAPSVSEASSLLLSLCELPESDPRRSLVKKLARPLWSSIQLPHGRIVTHGQNDLSSDDAFQDYFPGQVLLALAAAVDATATEFKDQSPKTKALSPENLERLDRSFRYYRHRFRYKRNFGQVAWLLQAFSKWWRVTHEDRFAELVFEIADWVLGYQQEKTGAFINDHQAESPGYTTAVYLEGIAAAMGVAADLEDMSRYRKYHDSFIDGFRFLDRLIIQERDRSIIPNMDFALGGLRQGIHYSSIRIDFVQHSLSALLEFESVRRLEGFETHQARAALLLQ
jgi:hypothetical protein